MHLWLVGMMGSGKTRVGALVAEAAGVRFRDTDEEVASRLGCSIGRLWGTRGESAFRDLEAATVRRLAAEPRSVIATGGGVVLDPANVDTMRTSGLVVWLQARPDTLAGRVGAGEGRPLLEGSDPRTRLAEILVEREPLYRAAAHHRVQTDGRSPEQVAEEVLGCWTGS